MANKYDKHELIALLEAKRDEIIRDNSQKIADYENAFEEWRETVVSKVAEMVNDTTPDEPHKRYWGDLGPPTKPVMGNYQGLRSTQEYDKAIRQVSAIAGDVVELRNGTDITSLL